TASAAEAVPFPPPIPRPNVWQAAHIPYPRRISYDPRTSAPSRTAGKRGPMHPSTSAKRSGGSMFRTKLSLSILAALCAAPVLAQPIAQPLPEGEGKQLVEQVCIQCHGLEQIMRATGYAADDWREVFGTMVRMADAQADTLAAYLAEHSPPRPGQEPVLLDGDTRIRITEWQAPTLGQRSRDPIQAPDGSI